MRNVSAPEPIGKGMWLSDRELKDLTAAREAGEVARTAALGERRAEAAAEAQATALRNTSWRTRFLALVEEVLRSNPGDPALGSADPLGLAMGILELAPAARSITIPPEEELWNCEQAARRFFGRAYSIQQAGGLKITIAADEARSLAVAILDLVDAVRDLA